MALTFAMADSIYEFNPDKNAWLIRERGISFNEIIALINEGMLVRISEHHNKEKYPNQLIYEVYVRGYIHAIPVEKRGEKIVMKTIFPSRKATKRHHKE